MEFRLLEADEIECRVAQVINTPKFKGVSILLYKDARVDQNILDETVGSYNWQRRHTRDNANCIVSIWDKDKNQWVEKEDVGTESNTEKEKGLASDSFKRACFNWGIGRELYTAPAILISDKDCYIYEDKGKLKCNDKFKVKSIGYDDKRNINALMIINAKTRKVCFTMGNVVEDNLATAQEKQIFLRRCEQLGVDYKQIAKQAGATSMKTMTKEEQGRCLIILKEIEDSRNE